MSHSSTSEGSILNEYSDFRTPLSHINEIYTPISEISSELESRRKDKKLMKKVEDFFGSCLFTELKQKPRAVLSRCIATPNMELFHFLNLSKQIKLIPLILEYPDKFVAKNPDKYHLCKLFFYRENAEGKKFLVDTRRIVNFNENEGKNFATIKTTWGENIIDFHHNLLTTAAPQLFDKVVNFTKWFKETRYLSNYYYLYYLASFICHGVLFENFLDGDKEESTFIAEKLLPSYQEVKRIFGLKPLIYPLLPITTATNTFWHGYSESIKVEIGAKSHNSTLSREAMV